MTSTSAYVLTHARNLSLQLAILQELGLFSNIFNTWHVRTNFVITKRLETAHLIGKINADKREYSSRTKAS
ncbi:hypothetical protein CAJAP_04366 [Camponotus japonicus]